MKPNILLAAFLCAVTLATGAGPASAHGLAGKRFFPATLVIDDPFVADELSLPLVSHIKRPKKEDEPRTRETEFKGEYAKRLTPNFGVILGGALIHKDPAEGNKATLTGFENLEVALRYQFFKSEAHEALLSLGLGWEVGGTGRKKTGAESFDVVNPTLLFGKGFGDLPDALPFLKPLAVTGVLGGKIPTRPSTRKSKLERKPDGDLELEIEKERNPNILQWGFVFEYSIPYLQSFVKDIGLPAPFNRIIPLVELSLETPLDSGQGGKTKGTVNPGIIWAGRVFQVGLEAIFPVNDRTGKNVGVLGQLHFFIDDLFPRSLGRPIWGR